MAEFLYKKAKVMEKLKPMMFVVRVPDVGKRCCVRRCAGYSGRMVTARHPSSRRNMALNSYSTLTGGEIGRNTGSAGRAWG